MSSQTGIITIFNPFDDIIIFVLGTGIRNSRSESSRFPNRPSIDDSGILKKKIFPQCVNRFTILQSQSHELVPKAIPARVT